MLLTCRTDELLIQRSSFLCAELASLACRCNTALSLLSRSIVTIEPIQVPVDSRIARRAVSGGLLLESFARNVDANVFQIFFEFKVVVVHVVVAVHLGTGAVR